MSLGQCEAVFFNYTSYPAAMNIMRYDRQDYLESIAAYASGRGGEVTYHGPGQLICYVIADLRAEKDLHRHVHRLEEMIILTLADFDISAERNPRGIGVWVEGKKIAAVGVRCRKWITFHGIALNINPNLRHFTGIVPCGMTDAPVTSMHALGATVSREHVELAIRRHCDIFSRNRRCSNPVYP